jgi:hypothetical protein
VLLPPWREGWDGREVLSSPPPEPSPIKGEGSGSQVPHMTYLPLSAPRPPLSRGGTSAAPNDNICAEQYCPLPEGALHNKSVLDPLI